MSDSGVRMSFDQESSYGFLAGISFAGSVFASSRRTLMESPKKELFDQIRGFRVRLRGGERRREERGGDDESWELQGQTAGPENKGKSEEMLRAPTYPLSGKQARSSTVFDYLHAILEQVTNTLQHNGFRVLLSREVYSRRRGSQLRGLLFFWSVPRWVEYRARGDSLSAMSVLDFSNFAGLAAIGLLTTNIALGLLISMKYNPVRSWPHRRINTVGLHNWTGYTALLMALVHPGLLLLLSTPVFRLVDIVWPVNAPKQPWINLLGALALYVLIFVVTTSVLWQESHAMSRRLWKKLHFATYAMYPLYAVHAIFTDPALKDRPVDWIDAEKVFVEACVLGVAAGIAYRIKWQRRQPAARVHRARAA